MRKPLFDVASIDKRVIPLIHAWKFRIFDGQSFCCRQATIRMLRLTYTLLQIVPEERDPAEADHDALE